MKTMKYKMLAFLMMLIASPVVSFGQNDNQVPSDEFCKVKCDELLGPLIQYCKDPKESCITYYAIRDVFKLAEDGCTEAQNFLKSPRNYLSGDNKRIEEIEEHIKKDERPWDSRFDYRLEELNSNSAYISFESSIKTIFALADGGCIEAQNFLKSPRNYLSEDNKRIKEIERFIEQENVNFLISKLDLANFLIIDSLARNGNKRAQEYLNSPDRASYETFQNCLKYKNITPEEKNSVLRLKADCKRRSSNEKDVLRLARYYAKLGDWYDVEKMPNIRSYVIGNPLFEREKLQILNKKDAEECFNIAYRYENTKQSYKEKQELLDSAEVWYKHAASFDAKYKKWVTAIEFKKKTGKDYYEEKEKQKQQNQQQAYVNSLIKKYGKQYVTAASNGNVIIGMPEEVFLAYSSPFSTTLIEQTATTKIYRISYTGIVSGQRKYEYIWFKNGRVTRIRK